MPTIHTTVEPAKKDKDGLYHIRLGTGDNLNPRGIPNVSEVLFDDFKNNPIILFEHNQQEFPVAQVKKLKYVPEENAVDAAIMFMDDEPGVNLKKIPQVVFNVHHAYDIGYIRGASMGVKKNTKQLREVTLTSVPFDPTALQLAHREMFDDWFDSLDDDMVRASYVDKDDGTTDTNNNETTRDVTETQEATEPTNMPETIDTAKLIREELTAQLQTLAPTLVTEVVKALNDQEAAKVAATKEAEDRKVEAEQNLKDALAKAGLSTEQLEAIRKGNEAAEAKTKEEEDAAAAAVAEAQATAAGTSTATTETATATTTTTTETTETPPVEETVEEARERMRGELRTELKERQTLLATASLMLPDDFEEDGKSDHEILTAALGDAASDGDSDEYLRGKLEVMAETRKGSESTSLVTASLNGGASEDKDAPYNKYVNRIQNAWKNPGGKKVDS